MLNGLTRRQGIAPNTLPRLAVLLTAPPPHRVPWPLMALERSWVAQLTQWLLQLPIMAHQHGSPPAPPSLHCAAPAEDALPLTVLERSWEAQLTKCLCSCPSRPAGAQHVQLFVQSKACPVVDFSPGCRLLVYAPWCEVQLPGQQAPVVLAHLVVQAM